MQQKRWIKLIKDFDCVIDYHPRKANMVTNAFSHKNKVVIEIIKKDDEKELIDFKEIDAKVEVGLKGSLLAQLRVRSVLRDIVLEVQERDIKVNKMWDKENWGLRHPSKSWMIRWWWWVDLSVRR